MNINWKKALWIIPLAIICVPFLAYQNMKERKAGELGEIVNDLDNRIKDLKISVNRDGTFITYTNGFINRADGLGIAVVTSKDNEQVPERLKEQNINVADFPVIVFFNISGFDASGTPQVVRRASDGNVLWPKITDPTVAKLVRAAIPLSNGGWLVYYWDRPEHTGKTEVSDEAWAKYYLNIPTQPQLPPPEELDKMTDEQLKAIGIQRKPKEKDESKEELKEKPKEKEETKEKEKTGIKGNVFKVGGNPALVPLKVPVYVFKGKLEATPKKEDSIANTTSDSEGKYSIPLPSGEYTLAIELDGKLIGNALKEKFPSVKVKDSWVSYDIRKGN